MKRWRSRLGAAAVALAVAAGVVVTPSPAAAAYYFCATGDWGYTEPNIRPSSDGRAVWKLTNLTNGWSRFQVIDVTPDPDVILLTPYTDQLYYWSRPYAGTGTHSGVISGLNPNHYYRLKVDCGTWTDASFDPVGGGAGGGVIRPR